MKRKNGCDRAAQSRNTNKSTLPAFFNLPYPHFPHRNQANRHLAMSTRKVYGGPIIWTPFIVDFSQKKLAQGVIANSAGNSILGLGSASQWIG